MSNTTTTNKTININSLVTRAMLASLTLKRFQNRKLDKEATAKVAADFGMQDASLGAYRKETIAKEALKEISAIDSQARQVHYKYTLPYEEGWSLLTNSNLLAYRNELFELQAKRQKAVDALRDNLPTLIENQKQRLGGLWKAEDYPSIDEIVSKYEFSFEIKPLPDKDDWRVKAVDKESERVQEAMLKEMESKTQERLKEAMKDPYRRLKTVLEKASEKLNKYCVITDDAGDAKVQNPFRDTLISNITDLLDLLPALNFSDDPELDKLSKEIRDNITKYTPDQLRESPDLRKEAAMSVDSVLAKIDGIIA